MVEGGEDEEEWDGEGRRRRERRLRGEMGGKRCRERVRIGGETRQREWVRDEEGTERVSMKENRRGTRDRRDLERVRRVRRGEIGEGVSSWERGERLVTAKGEDEGKEDEKDGVEMSDQLGERRERDCARDEERRREDERIEERRDRREAEEVESERSDDEN
ncbi:hypothetical protein Tco_1089606 [Tanacetum coccineum]